MPSFTVTQSTNSANTAGDLAFAFGSMSVSKRKSPVAGSAADIDLRDFSQPDRELLARGPRVLIRVGDLTVIDLPCALFMAASTKPDLLTNGRVFLPHETAPQGVLRLITYITDVPWWRKPNLRMMSSNDISEMLSTTAATAALGMDKYTDHIYRKCEANLRKHLPSYTDLEGLKFFAKVHPRLLEITASQNLAVRVWEGTIPDAAVFAEYLEYNTILGDKVEVALQKHEVWLKNKIDREEKQRAWAERAELEKAAAIKATAECTKRQAQQAKKQKEKDVKDKAFWDRRKAEAAQDEESIKKKLTLSANKRKFTPRERAHWSRTRGKKLPKGC